MNTLQTAAFLGFCRQFLTFYVECFCVSKDEQDKVLRIN